MKAYNAMHLLPQITVTAILMTDKTLNLVKNLVHSIWTWISYNVKCTLNSKVWYNTNADDAVSFNLVFCIYNPPPPPPYPLVLGNAATAI